MSKRIDLTGQQFGRLTVIRYDGTRNRSACWHCQCTCGAELSIRAGHLKSGNTQSCGCLKREQLNDRCTTHGQYSHMLFVTWKNMIDRCHNENCTAFQYYGGRGIAVAPEWHDVRQFIADVEATLGPRPDGHTIDRIDNNRGYEPGNVRWATRVQQQRNRRTNRLLSLDGVTRTVAEWAEITGIPENTIHMRMKLGWSVSDALTNPVRTKRKQARCLTLDGETRTQAEWARITGIPDNTICKRLKHGWSVRDALTKLVQKTHRAG